MARVAGGGASRVCTAPHSSASAARTIFTVTGPLLEVISRHWGYSTLPPLQQEAMTAALSGRDSLVVLPTGGGKSLCYQAPALLKNELTVVVSPLISLMNDQVDSLLGAGFRGAHPASSPCPP